MAGVRFEAAHQLKRCSEVLSSLLTIERGCQSVEEKCLRLIYFLPRNLAAKKFCVVDFWELLQFS